MGMLIGNPMIFRQLPLDMALAKMAELGHDALELWPPQIETCRTPSLCRQLAEYIRSLGLKAIRLNAADRAYFQTLGRGDDVGNVVAGLQADIDLAASLGMSQLLTWEGRCPAGAGRQDRYGWLLDQTTRAFERAIAHGRRKGVSLSIEVHPYTVGIDLDWTIDLCDRLDDSAFGVTYDCCHFAVGLPDDYIAAVHKLARRIKHVHFCDSDRVTSELHFAPGAGCLDLDAIVEALRTVGFDGTMMLDLWLYPLPEHGSRVGVPYLRKVMDKLGLE